MKNKEEDEETRAILERLEGFVEIVCPTAEEEQIKEFLEKGGPPPPGMTAETVQEELRGLQKEKEEVLRKIEEAMAYLHTTPAGLDKPLINPEGFPRADCDLYAVRESRRTVNCGRNELRRLQDLLMTKLGLLHALTKDVAAEQMAHDKPVIAKHHREVQERREYEAAMNKVRLLPPMLLVGRVEPDSPAHYGGLRAGQLVLQFGELTAENLEREGGLPAMGKAVEDAAGRGGVIVVWVTEGNEKDRERAHIQRLVIVPMEWAGRGKLGCGFDSYQAATAS